MFYNPTLSISIYDYQIDLMNLSFKTNASIYTNNWYDLETLYNLTDGTYTFTPDMFDDFSEKYWWSVNCTDGENWNNKTYCFTTNEEPIWFNESWRYRKEITINQTQIIETLINYTILITIPTPSMN